MSQQGKLRVRRESLQRIQIGGAGLAGVFLIVVLSNIVINSARPDITMTDDNAIQQGAILAGAANGAAASDAASPDDNEPLAALGVTPKSDQAGTKPLTVAPAVPDLKPDPRLTNPMDRDPSAPDQGSNQALAPSP